MKPLGEDVTEELDYVPGRFVVNRIVRPHLACTCCEAICQAPLPSRPIERGRPGPGLLVRVPVAKYGDHLPLHRQSQIIEREGIDLDRSTLADWVGKATALLEPLADAIRRHVLGGPAIFADDTPIKLQAPGDGKTRTTRIWVYVRDERPGSALVHLPPAIGSASIARESIPSATCKTIRAGCTPTAILASTRSFGRAASARLPAWPISGASSRRLPG